MNISLVITISYIHLLAFSMGYGGYTKYWPNPKKMLDLGYAAMDTEGIIHNPFQSVKPSYFSDETGGFIRAAQNYSKEIAPEDAKVLVDMKIRRLSKVDTDAETISMSLKLELSWRDPRLDWPRGGPPEGKAFNLPTELLR